MLEQERIDLARHRLCASLEDYEAALSLFDGGHFKAANNRAYYCIFHAIRAVLALESKDFKKHSALISYFNQYYVATNIFGKQYSKIATQASMIRSASDYDDFFVVDKSNTKSQIESAKTFYETVEEYLNSRFAEENNK